MGDKRESVIIVDDDVTNLAVGRSALSEKYDVFTAPSGEKLFMLLNKILPNLILLDIEMPNMNGYEVIKKLKCVDDHKYIPVIFLSGKIDPESEIRCLNMGAVDYLTKPFSRDLLIRRIDLHILLEKQKDELFKHSLNLEREASKKSKTISEMHNAILKTVAELVECRDNFSGGHIERTQHYLRLLIEFLHTNDTYSEEISTWDVNQLVMSSQLHDVGKISIRDNILLKKDRLTKEEFEEIKKHTVYGVEIIREIDDGAQDSKFLHYAEILAGSHHESWDGKGYPLGLKGEEIPLQGRLLAIVDVYDALTNDRPYNKALTHEQALKVISEELGSRFDPLIKEIFLANEQEFKNTDTSFEKHSAARFGLNPTMKAVTNLVGSRSGKEFGHADRMQNYLRVFVDALQNHDYYNKEVSTWDTDLFLFSALMHDVGNIAIPDDILRKGEALSATEFEDVKDHVNFGVRIVSQVKGNIINGDLLHHAEMIVGSHHERWDGTGYPQGVSGEDIPLQGRIMAIVDVYDALTTERPHRRKMTHVEAVDIIKRGSGSHFDPGLVDVFLFCIDEFKMVTIA